MTAQAYYTERVAYAEKQITERAAKVRLFTLLRLFVFLAAAVALYFSWGNMGLFIGVFIAGTAVFLWIVSRSVDAKLALEKARQLKTINVHELSALAGDWSAFDAGLTFVDPAHPFSNDLDIFRPKGVFGFLNRTTTQKGKQALATLILQGNTDPEGMNRLIESLASEISWTQEFRVSGLIKSREQGTTKTLAGWTERGIENPVYLRWIIWIIPALAIPLTVLYALDWIPSGIYGALLIVLSSPTGRLLKTTNALATALGSYETRVAMMLEQVQSLRNLNSELPEVQQLKHDLLHGPLSAEKALKEWLAINQRFEMRMNILIAIPLNLFLAWDLRLRVSAEQWIKRYEDAVVHWEDVLTRLEVLISGATLRFNHPETTFAALSEAHADLEIRKMVHPLLPADVAVANDIVLAKENQFMILTGPNMAGKSTYLRALGLTIVFANAGFPVFAAHVKMQPMRLYSSMRTADDLSNQSSYFHAELTRLRFIMDALEKQERVFILLDEILKGTNSKDKEEGSKRFLSKLQRKGAKGIIATHDLSLCELSVSQQAFSNGCFDSIIDGENLYFDYLWKPGICQNMNASFLLKRMDLVD